MRVEAPEVVKALLDPRRQRLLKHFVTPRSVKEVAERVGAPPSQLYYHVRLLERHGILRAVAQRRAGSNVEHVYELAARRFEVAAGMGDLVRAPSAVTARLVETAQKYGAAMDDRRKGRRDPAVRAVHDVVHPLTHEQASALYARLREILRDLPAAGAGDADEAPRYGIHLMVAPLAPPGEDVL